MIAKQRVNGNVQVTFVVPAMEGCDCLSLVGEFNEWNDTVHPLQHKEDGSWSLTLELEPEREFEFRYYGSDGAWHNDPAADAYVANPYGSDNSVVSTKAV